MRMESCAVDPLCRFFCHARTNGMAQLLWKHKISECSSGVLGEPVESSDGVGAVGHDRHRLRRYQPVEALLKGAADRYLPRPSPGDLWHVRLAQKTRMRTYLFR